MDKKIIYLALVVVVLIAMSATAVMYTPEEVAEEGGNDAKGALTGDDVEPLLGNGSCELVDLQEGNTGTLEIPVLGAAVAETDVKHHWDMPEGKIKVEATLTWESGWELTFDIGLGECPNSGEMLATQTDSSGSITLIYEASSGEELITGQWFAHVKVPDINAHRGDSCDYSMMIKLCSACEGEGEDCGGSCE